MCSNDKTRFTRGKCDSWHIEGLLDPIQKSGVARSMTRHSLLASDHSPENRDTTEYGVSGSYYS